MNAIHLFGELGCYCCTKAACASHCSCY